MNWKQFRKLGEVFNTWSDYPVWTKITEWNESSQTPMYLSILAYGYYVDKEGSRYPVKAIFQCYSANDVLQGVDGYYTVAEATHWMPLPITPEETETI